MSRAPLTAMCPSHHWQVEATSVQEVLGVLRTGSMNRTTASTLMNDTSSRSHAVFTITIESTPKDGGWVVLFPALSPPPHHDDRPPYPLLAPSLSPRPGPARCPFGLPLLLNLPVVDSDIGSEAVGAETQSKFVSKLTFVDLAGSERLKRTQVRPSGDHPCPAYICTFCTIRGCPAPINCCTVVRRRVPA